MSKTTLEPSPVPRGISAGEERTKLYKLCYRNLPAYRKELVGANYEWYGLDIARIASEIGISKQKVSGWMKNNSIPGQRVAAMIALDDSTLTFEKLGPFITSR